MSQFNNSIKVFSELFVGVQSASKNEIPLGFATPYENNAAGRKRQETVKNWVFGGRKEIESQLRILKNVPRAGFRITSDVKRVYWGGGNVVWRVEDPDGFELEIQSQNLMSIIQVSGIQENGLIPGQCLWGRDSGANILLHEKSQEFKNAILAAETIKKPTSLTQSKLTVGNSYKLANGSTGRYLGKWWVNGYERDKSDDSTSYQRYWYRGYERALVDISSKQYAEVEYAPISPGSFGAYFAVKIGEEVMLYKSISMLEEVKESPIALDAAQKIINGCTMRLAASSEVNDRRLVLNVSAKELKNPKFEYVQLVEEDLDAKKAVAARNYSGSYTSSFINHFRASDNITVYKDDDGRMFSGNSFCASESGISAFEMPIRKSGKVFTVRYLYERQRYSYMTSSNIAAGDTATADETLSVRFFKKQTAADQKQSVIDAIKAGKMFKLDVVESV